MKVLFQKFLNLILPPRCPYCGEIVCLPDALCEDCFNKIEFISAPYCHICGAPFENEKDANISRVCADCAAHKKITRFNRSAVIYDDFFKSGLHRFKFHDQIFFSKLYAKWLKTGGEDIFKNGVDLIVPVPLSYQRLFKRRYNQSALLAKELSKLVCVPVDLNCLKKVKNTKPQSSLSEKQRLKNLKNAFEIKDKFSVCDKRIVLVDDVMTTGATLFECAKVLIKAGAKSVDTLTIARTKKS